MTKEELRAYHRAYRKANPEKIRAWSKAFRERNPEKEKVRHKIYYDANSEKVRKRTNAYCKANPEKYRIFHKAWRQTHPEKASAHDKTYREANPEKHSARYKAWAQANPEKIRERSRTRWVLKHKSQVESINEKVVYLRDGWICQICHKRVYKKVKYPDSMSPSLDHIIPLSKGGSHIYANVQLAHFGCNSGKKDNILLQGEQLRMF